MRKGVSVILSIMLVMYSSMPLLAQNSRRFLRKYEGKRPLGSKKIESSPKTQFGLIQAYSDGSAALVEWEMEVETGVLGYDVYRIDKTGRHIVTETLVNGSGLIYGREPAYGNKYSFYDPDGDINSLYQIESVGIEGSKLQSPIKSVNPTKKLKSGSPGSPGSDFYERPRAVLPISSELNLPPDLSAEVASNELIPDVETHRSVVSQPGVKIGVKREGFYRVYAADLIANGFDVSNPANWQLYLDGNEQAIRVGPKGSYFEFYGKGVDTNETDTRSYFLISGTVPGRRMGVRVAQANTSPEGSDSFGQTFFYKERTLFSNQIRNGSAENFWGRTIRNTGTSLSFNLYNIDFSSPTSFLTLKLQGFSSGLHQVSIVLNGHTLSPANGASQISYSTVQQIPTSYLLEGTNTIQLASTASTSDTSFFDTVKVEFARKYVALGNELAFYAQNDQQSLVTGFSSPNIRMIETTYEGNPVEVIKLVSQLDGDFYAVRMPAGRAGVFLAFEASQVLTPASITPINTDLLQSPANGADLIIITHNSFTQEAEEWANYRRSQGLAVKVVDVNDIYDEFNSGILSADSIKSFLNYAYNNWQVQPRYVLLIGDTTYDPREHLNAGFANYVPTRFIDTLFSETGSDEFLGDFNADGLSELRIGRIPARTGERVRIALNKVMQWEANLTDPLARGALFAFDLPEGYDFEGMSGRLRNQLPQSTPITMISRGQAESQAAVVGEINNGHFIINYSGHGSTATWAKISFFSSFNITCTNGATNCLERTGNISLFTMLTCLNGFFLNLNNDSLAESLVFFENGGAVAAWASSGLTTPDVQEIMGQRFYSQLGAGNITRMGDLIEDAKAQIPGGTDVRLSWSLIGDPMLKVR